MIKDFCATAKALWGGEYQKKKDEYKRSVLTHMTEMRVRDPYYAIESMQTGAMGLVLLKVVLDEIKKEYEEGHITFNF